MKNLFRHLKDKCMIAFNILNKNIISVSPNGPKKIVKTFLEHLHIIVPGFIIRNVFKPIYNFYIGIHRIRAIVINSNLNINSKVVVPKTVIYIFLSFTKKDNCH